MNSLVPLTVALLLSVAAASLFAQDGTAPEGMGSTGWTSASRAQTGAAMSANRSDPEAAPQQPFIATGADLNGAHIAAFENAPQPDDRCLIQMFPNPSFCRAPPCMGGDGLDPAVRPPARLSYRYHQFISRRHGDPPHPRLHSRISVERN